MRLIKNQIPRRLCPRPRNRRDLLRERRETEWFREVPFWVLVCAYLGRSEELKAGRLGRCEGEQMSYLAIRIQRPGNGICEPIQRYTFEDGFERRVFVCPIHEFFANPKYSAIK